MTPSIGRGQHDPGWTAIVLRQIAVLWEANDLGFPVKEFVETLEGIRIGVVSQGDEPGVIVESRTKRQEDLAARFRLTDMLPVLNEVTA